jgi:hypothetical protein
MPRRPASASLLLREMSYRSTFPAGKLRGGSRNQTNDGTLANMFGSLTLVAVLMAQAARSAPQTASPKPAARSAPSTARPATARPRTATPPPLTTDDQKTIYSLGLSIYRSLAQFDLSPEEIEIVKRGITDAAAHKPALDLDTWGPKIHARCV